MFSLQLYKFIKIQHTLLFKLSKVFTKPYSIYEFTYTYKKLLSTNYYLISKIVLKSRLTQFVNVVLETLILYKNVMLHFIIYIKLVKALFMNFPKNIFLILKVFNKSVTVLLSVYISSRKWFLLKKILTLKKKVPK